MGRIVFAFVAIFATIAGLCNIAAGLNGALDFAAMQDSLYAWILIALFCIWSLFFVYTWENEDS